MTTTQREHLPKSNGKQLSTTVKAYRALVGAVWAEEWKRVPALARSAMTTGTNVAKEDQRVGYEQKDARRTARADTFAQLLQTLSGSAAGRQQLGQIHKKLKGAKSGITLQFRRDIGKLAQGKVRKASTLDSLAFLRQPSDARREVGHAAAALIARGLQGIFIAKFNQSFHKEIRKPSAGKSKLGDCKKVTSAAHKEVRAGERAVQLVSTGSLSKRRTAANALLRICRRHIPKLAAAQGVLVAALWREFHAKNGRPARFQANLLAASALTRELLAAHAAALRMTFDLPSADEQRSSAIEAVNRGAAIAFAPNDQLPKAISPSALLKRKVSTKQVAVEGIVVSVTASRTRSKELIGTVEVQDIKGTGQIRFVAKYTHLGHLGITPGAFVRGVGVFKKRSAMAKNKPALELMRESLAADSAKSWHTAFLTSGEDYFRWKPNGVALAWSVGPQMRTHGKWASDFLGAGEAIWGPLVSGRGKTY